jgi:hypothetical protein
MDQWLAIGIFILGAGTGALVTQIARMSLHARRNTLDSGDVVRTGQCNANLGAVHTDSSNRPLTLHTVEPK